MSKLIGTAGHVDHGKTSLIQALTGTDADRLPEEKRRGLTIDIGFAYIELPEVGRVSIVDVPGHERFVTNMLVGALGIDVALLCIAADESVMPQTREHFQILTLLPVERMVVALTRSDLVDEDTIAISRTEAEELLAPTRFAGSPIVPVSSLTGDGLDQLRIELAKALQGESQGLDKPWYLPIDRVFTIKGHGAVVTGTLMDGVVRAGDEVEIEPGGIKARVRQIQGHDSTLEKSEKGQRTALNLSGVKEEDLHRGLVAGVPGTVFETRVIDSQLNWIQKPKHGARIRLSIGADEVIGKVFFNEHDPNLAQFRLERNTGAVAGQPVIVRQYSPPHVLGGGRVTAPEAPVRKIRDRVAEAKGQSLEESVFGLVVGAESGILTEEVCRAVGRTPQILGDVFEELRSDRHILGFAGLWITPTNFTEVTEQLKNTLEKLHLESPSKLQFPRELVVKQAGFGWQGKPLDRIVTWLAELGVLKSTAAGIGLAHWAANLNPAQRALLDRTKQHLISSGWNVPSPRDIASSLNIPIQAVDAILKIGIEVGELVRLDETVWYARSQVNELIGAARAQFGEKSFSASEFRDFFATSRKYAIPILEHLDSRQVTYRQGDNRYFVQTK